MTVGRHECKSYILRLTALQAPVNLRALDNNKLEITWTATTCPMSLMQNVRTTTNQYTQPENKKSAIVLGLKRCYDETETMEQIL